MDEGPPKADVIGKLAAFDFVAGDVWCRNGELNRDDVAGDLYSHTVVKTNDDFILDANFRQFEHLAATRPTYYLP